MNIAIIAIVSILIFVAGICVGGWVAFEGWRYVLKEKGYVEFEDIPSKNNK